MMAWVAALIVAASVQAGARSSETESAATPLKAAGKAAQKDADTPEGRDWEGRHTSSWLGPALTPVMKECMARSAEGHEKKFAVYLRLSASGVAREALVDPSTPFAECSRQGVKQLNYPGVPREGYWLQINMSIRK